MLLGLRSRCAMPRRWPEPTASHAVANSRTMSRRGARDSSAQRAIARPPSTSSIAKYGCGLPSLGRCSVPAAITRAMFGWSSRARNSDSLRKRASVAGRAAAECSTFTAILRVGSSCSASNTVPMPPTPITRRSVNPPTESPMHDSESKRPLRRTPSVGSVEPSNCSSDRTSARTHGSCDPASIAASRCSGGSARTASNRSSATRWRSEFGSGCGASCRSIGTPCVKRLPRSHASATRARNSTVCSPCAERYPAGSRFPRWKSPK